LTLAGVQWVLGHAHLSATEVYLHPRELHQTGEKPQVAWSQRHTEGLCSLYELAV
jgi:integrase/recombinase XerD